MDADSIDKLEAGPELDALIADEVMGLEVLGVTLVNRDPECCSCLMIPYDGRPRHGAFERPVYLDDCICEDKEDFIGGSDADYFGHHGMCLKVVPSYSTDIAASWEVINKMIVCTAYECYLSHQFDGWDCLFAAPASPMGHADNSPAPLAICRAALKAVIDTNGDN